MTPFGESAMRPSFIVAIAASMLAGQALAQSAPPADRDLPFDPSPSLEQDLNNDAPNIEESLPSANESVESRESEPTAPRVGASTITEDEAKATFESQGFRQVTELKKNDDGVWIGKAQRDGDSFEVALDFEGNVFYRAAS